MFSCVEHMHTFAYMLSKSPLFPPYHFPLCSFSPSCTLLPALICSAFHLGRGLWVQRQRESRGRGEGGVATRGHEEREEPESPYLRWYAACTHRGHCSVEAPVISLRSVWPSFFCSSFPPPCSLTSCSSRQKISTHRGADGSEGLGWIFPDRLSVPMSSGLRVFACTCWQNMNPCIARRQSRTGRVKEREKGARTSGPHDETMRLWQRP